MTKQYCRYEKSEKANEFSLQERVVTCCWLPAVDAAAAIGAEWAAAAAAAAADRACRADR